MTAAAVLTDAITDSGRISGGWTVTQDPAYQPSTDEGPLSVYRRQAVLDDGSRVDHWFLVNVSSGGLVPVFTACRDRRLWLLLPPPPPLPPQRATVCPLGGQCIGYPQ